MTHLGCTRRARALRAFAQLFALLCSLSSVSAAHAQAPAESASAESEARAHFKLGEAYYNTGKFADAAHEFDEAYRISRRPALLYNMYLADRDAGRVQAAAEALDAYLRAMPDDPRADSLRVRLQALRQASADRSAADAANAANAGDAKPAQHAARNDTETAATKPDTNAASAVSAPAAKPRPASLVLPIAFWGGAGALLIGAGLTQWLAANKHDDLQKLCPAGDCTKAGAAADHRGSQLQSQGKTFVTASYVLLAGGIVSAAVGTGLYFLTGRKPSQTEASTAPATSAALECGAERCVATLRGAF